MKRTRHGMILALGILSLGLLASPYQAVAADLAPLEIKLPKPRFEGTPKNLPADLHLDKENGGKPRPVFMAPKGVVNLAKGKTVTSSDANPLIGSLDQLTDGDRESIDGSIVELAPGTQWVQIDLGAPSEISAVLFWHRFENIRVYRDVIVQVADDSDFLTNVQTLFNNDSDNSSGLGLGKDFEYVDTNEGKLVDAKGVKARYVRVYSKGSTSDAANHYTEVEVYGLPVAK